MPPAAGSALDTPLMRQYQALKASYPHALLFFRLGDFYELFADDARAASPALGLVLTARQGIPMCGVPVHSASNYIAKLLKAGFKVAIAEQMEDPSQAKGLVRREVVRLVTPGTIVEEDLLESKSSNYLVALELDSVGWGIACVEVSTGEFWASQAFNDHGRRQLLSIIARLDPAELLLCPAAAEELHLKSILQPKTALTFYEAPRRNGDSFTWSKDALWQNHPLASKAAVKAAHYVCDTQTQLQNTLHPRYSETHGDLQLDEAAIRTLELVRSSLGERSHSLWAVLDRCQTPMGSRRLRAWLLHPSLDLKEIERRQNSIEELNDKAEAARALSQILGEISDLERLVSRLSTRSASPRDLAALRDSLVHLDALRTWLADTQFCSGLAAAAAALDELFPALKEQAHLLEAALAEHPPAKLQDGGIFRKGFDTDLDELRAIKDDSRRFLAELEAKERTETGIPSLKIAFNSVFGYYIEVTKAQLAKVPARYQRKQTLANAERYLTPELKELESKILGAEERILRLEMELFERLRSKITEGHLILLRFAALIAELDALKALAEVARVNDWVKPKVDLSHDLKIEDGRHPIVEAVLPAGTFVPNSLDLDGRQKQVLVITGPNMGGKSTYLRQNALIAILAQMGSFVPARSATIGLVDKVLTRIGSQDALSRNESTFMVEMRETAHILRSATDRSLVVLDEVGRGTSTFDGISIAWAVLEHLRSLRRPGESDAAGPRTLFATHYFELTELSSQLAGVLNANVEAREWTNAEGRTDVVFLHKISPGPADRSFGIHVARLAGLPESCLSRAREILETLENKSKAPDAAAPTLPLFENHPILQELHAAHPEDMTPIQALNLLSSWKKRL